MRTDKELRKGLARVMQIANTKTMRDSFIANLILNEMDGILARSWSHVSDMGITNTEFNKIRRIVKKRL